MSSYPLERSDALAARPRPREVVLFAAGMLMPLQIIDNAIVIAGQTIPLSLLLALAAVDIFRLRRSNAFVPLLIALAFLGSKVLCGGTLLLVGQYVILGSIFLSFPRERYEAIFKGFAVGLLISVAIGTAEYIISIMAPDLALTIYAEAYRFFLGTREVHWNLVGNVLPLPRVPGLAYEPAFLGLFADVLAVFMFVKPKALSRWWVVLVLVALVIANSRTSSAAGLLLLAMVMLRRPEVPDWVKAAAGVVALGAPLVVLLAVWADPSSLYRADNPSYFARIYPISRFVVMHSDVNHLVGVCNYENFMKADVSKHPVSYAVVERLHIMKDAKSLLGNSLFRFGAAGTLLFWIAGLAALRWRTRGAAGWAMLPLVFLNVAAFSWVTFWAIWGGVYAGEQEIRRHE